MQIAVLVYPFFPNFYSLVTFMDTIFKTHYKDLGTNTSSQTKFFMKKNSKLIVKILCKCVVSSCHLRGLCPHLRDNMYD